MPSELFTTPILFMIFNRPDTTARVFERIRGIKPSRLFVSADGPRLQKPDEAEQCIQARAVIQKIDWECEVKTKFSDKNQGCKMGVSSAINWFFEHVDEGIILEDDCLPDISFFPFCQTLLELYRNDERIMHIGGSNFQDGKLRGDGSYFFSGINHIWGWATWKRAWKQYDVQIRSLPSLRNNEIFRTVFPSVYERTFWLKQFDLVHANKKDTWDIQWQFTMSVHHGIAILPNINLITNIGFDESATHTIDPSNKLANRPAGSIESIKHPSAIRVNREADAYVVRKYLHPNKMRKLFRLIQNLCR